MIWTLLIGLVVGIIAKALMPGKEPGGIIMTILLGIGGSFVGTWLGSMVGFYDRGESAGFIASVIGAVIILWVYRKFSGRAGA
jgi:uncharacterized membrane protein YeaQ/YmgE (transglycosylase-associated protein family)